MYAHDDCCHKAENEYDKSSTAAEALEPVSLVPGSDLPTAKWGYAGSDSWQVSATITGGAGQVQEQPSEATLDSLVS